MNNLQPHFHLRCSWEELNPKELGEMPTHLPSKWNNQEDAGGPVTCFTWGRFRQADVGRTRNAEINRLVARSVSCAFVIGHVLPQKTSTTLYFHL